MRPQLIGHRSETVRRANLSAIVRALHASGPLSRSELVARTGLTRSAIRGHIGELEAAGLVSEERPVPLGLPGRPSPVVSLDGDRASVLALEINVDSLAAAHVGPAGEIIDHRPQAASSRPQLGRRGRGRPGDPGHRRPSRSARRRRRWSASAWPSPASCAARTAWSARLPTWAGATSPSPSRWHGRSRHEVPVTVANDADLGALAESRRGAAMGADDVIYVSGEVGIGGGIIVDGRPLSGAAGYGGEIGHMPVNPDGAPCRCGSTGCWETEIGEDVLLALAGQHERGGQAAVDGVLAAADAGEPTAQAALDHIGRWLGIGLAGLVNIFDPRIIVLGGRFARLAPYVSAMVEAELDRHALAAPRDLVRVVPATLGDQAPLLGAAELAMEPLLADPAAWLGPRSGDAQRDRIFIRQTGTGGW